jgi:hypothetical protein
MKDRRPYRPGDLLRAFDRLHPSEDVKVQIAAMLGLPYRAVPAEAAGADEKADERIEPVPKPLPEEPPGRPSLKELEPTDSLPSRWRNIERGARRPPSWMRQVEPLTAQPPSRPGPKLESLWAPQWTRAILSATMAAPDARGAINWAEVVEAVASLRPLREFPSRLTWSAARGVQLLLDKSASMMPFAEDRSLLEMEVRKIAGAGLEVLSFAGCPARGAGSGIRLRWKPYEQLPPPRIGATVLVVTDLGIGHATGTEAPATVAEWLSFATCVRSRNCRLTAVVPYAPARWPQRLARVMDIVCWSRETTAGAAHQARKIRP